MRDNEIRIAIAEECGWARKNYCQGSYFWQRGDTTYDLADLPNYLNDLNAMHEAELTVDQIADYGSSRSRYFAWLLVTTGICDGYSEAKSFPVNFVNGERIVSATARQRAEAFLRTIGKWTDTPDHDQQPTT